MERKIIFKTDIGKMREENQDSGEYINLSPDIDFLIVADGMGGYTGGSEASRLVVKGVIEHLKNTPIEKIKKKPFKVMTKGVEASNELIRESAKKNQELKDMGSTCVCALVIGNQAYFLHVGDSRAYLLRNGEIIQITEDHSVVQELVRAGYVRPEDAPYHPNAGILTKCVGQMYHPQPENDGPINLKEGDILLLCSDGLYGMLDDIELAYIVYKNVPDRAGDILIKEANAAGGFDNITVILYYYGEFINNIDELDIKVGTPLYEEKYEEEITTMTLPYLKTVDINTAVASSKKIALWLIIASGLILLITLIWYLLSFN